MPDLRSGVDQVTSRLGVKLTWKRRLVSIEATPIRESITDQLTRHARLRRLEPEG